MTGKYRRRKKPRIDFIEGYSPASDFGVVLVMDGKVVEVHSPSAKWSSMTSRQLLKKIQKGTRISRDYL